MGTLEESIAQAEQALNAGPGVGVGGGGEGHAKELLAQVVAKKPTHHRANMLLAMIAMAHDDYAAAVFHLNRAILGNAKDAEARFMLGNCSLAINKVKEAAAAFKACLTLAPTYAPAWDGLGKSYLRLDKTAEADQAFESGIRATQGQDPWPFYQWANTLMVMGDMDKAAQVALRGLQASGSDQRGINLLEIAAFARNFVDQPGEAIEALKVDRGLHDRIGEVYAHVRQASEHTGKPHTQRPTIEVAKRPLRVGFLSGDFGHHVCAAFMKPALLNFDPSRVIPYCYNTQPEDGGEGSFKEACQWRDVTMLNDDQLASRILEDQIDVLIECSGLTPGRKQRAMTPRIAPVQCTWLGYPNTTGLPTMDYRMVDAITDPVGSEWQCRERLARIEGCFLCYTSNPWAGEVVPTEAMQGGGDLTAPITFGSFNRITKISDRTVRVWCEVLKSVPRSRLLIKLKTLTAGHMQRVLSRFTAHGVEASRIEIAPWEYDAAAHARMYAKLDIALDTFPYNGTTTTCEALWMGVPVIAMEGDSHRSRVGASLLTAIGAQEWVAKDEAQFVEIAAKLAAPANRNHLRETRMSLRQRMMDSPLRDEKGYARRVEACIEWMWGDAARG